MHAACRSSRLPFFSGRLRQSGGLGKSRQPQGTSPDYAGYRATHAAIAGLVRPVPAMTVSKRLYQLVNSR
jgi:hypothetical protein